MLKNTLASETMLQNNLELKSKHVFLMLFWSFLFSYVYSFLGMNGLLNVLKISFVSISFGISLMFLCSTNVKKWLVRNNKLSSFHKLNYGLVTTSLGIALFQTDFSSEWMKFLLAIVISGMLAILLPFIMKHLKKHQNELAAFPILIAFVSCVI